LTSFRIELDSSSGVPIYRQIMSQILFAIANGGLTAGAQLPTVRHLAVDLSVNPNTVIKAYKELELRGDLVTQQGTGTFIRANGVEISTSEKQRVLSDLCKDIIGRGGRYGLSVEELIEGLREFRKEE
jgi:GntR family transcriptional regulator